MAVLKIKDGDGQTKYLSVSGSGTEADPYVPYHDSPETVVNESNFVNEYLVDSGDSNDMGVNGSIAAVLFDYKPEAGKKLIGGRLMIYLEASTNFDSTKFANINALTSGIQVLCNGVEIDNWQDNIDLVTTFYDADGRAAFAKEAQSIAGRWTFSKAAGGFNGLTVLETNGFALKVRDDLSAAGLILRAKIQGRLVDA